MVQGNAPITPFMRVQRHACNGQKVAVKTASFSSQEAEKLGCRSLQNAPSGDGTTPLNEERYDGLGLETSMALTAASFDRESTL